jgi:hypothetical protein
MSIGIFIANRKLSSENISLEILVPLAIEKANEIGNGIVLLKNQILPTIFYRKLCW